jgi:hypothetical protein
MRKLVVDDRGIPTGKDLAFDRFDAPLGDLNLDAGFAALAEHPAFSLSGDGCRITLEFLENYRSSPAKSSGQHFAFAFRHNVCIDGDDRNGCKC